LESSSFSATDFGKNWEADGRELELTILIHIRISNVKTEKTLRNKN